MLFSSFQYLFKTIKKLTIEKLTPVEKKLIIYSRVIDCKILKVWGSKFNLRISISLFFSHFLLSRFRSAMRSYIASHLRISR